MAGNATLADMEFSYKVSEDEYMRASKIGIKRPRGPWARGVSYLYPATLFFAVWGSFLLGMIMERNDLVGVTAGDLHEGHAFRSMSPAPFWSASLIPALGIFCLLLICLRILFRVPMLRVRREQFRRNPGCQVETTVNVTPSSIAFRSATGSSESRWECYSTWAERDGVLVLVTHAGIRQILRIAGLSEPERAEFRGILSASIAKI
jgi:hypothetical protein